MVARWQRLFTTALFATLFMPGLGSAQDYPTREIRSIANFAPGTGMDIIIRYYSAKLAELAGKPVIVENKPGASGNIATEYLARSKPDGYTLMITPASSTLAAASYLFKRLPFDPARDLQPVVMLAEIGFVIVVPANSPAHSIKELTAVLRTKPGHGAYGTGSNTMTVVAEIYKAQAGLTTSSVMYKGLEILNDLYGGQIDFGTFGLTTVAEQIRTGKLRALAVTSTSRMSSLPDVPTMQEMGFADFDVSAWIGLFVPAGTPQPIVEKLATWHRQINATDEAKQMLLQSGMNLLDGDAATMSTRLRSDIVKWADYLRLAKIEPQ